MTRINLVPPSELSVKHLVAEYREITRLPSNLKKSLNRATPFSLDEIPGQYVLGTGHVKFFYNKMKFLEHRFESLVLEMLNRNYKPTYRDSSIFKQVPEQFYGDYTPTTEALKINRQRIRERTK